MKPKIGDNSWLGIMHPTCKVKVIDADTMKWRTIGECYDAPNPVAEVMRKAGVKTAWIVAFDGKRMVGEDGRAI